MEAGTDGPDQTNVPILIESAEESKDAIRGRRSRFLVSWLQDSGGQVLLRRPCL